MTDQQKPSDEAMRAAELLPCPFCGKKDYAIYGDDDNHIVSVFCNHCHTFGPQAGTEEDAIRYWNDRETNVGELVKALQITKSALTGTDAYHMIIDRKNMQSLGELLEKALLEHETNVGELVVAATEFVDLWKAFLNKREPFPADKFNHALERLNKALSKAGVR